MSKNEPIRTMQDVFQKDFLPKVKDILRENPGFYVNEIHSGGVNQPFSIQIAAYNDTELFDNYAAARFGFYQDDIALLKSLSAAKIRELAKAVRVAELKKELAELEK